MKLIFEGSYSQCIREAHMLECLCCICTWLIAATDEIGTFILYEEA
jgi:hypothetical protein